MLLKTEKICWFLDYERENVGELLYKEKNLPFLYYNSYR